MAMVSEIIFALPDFPNKYRGMPPGFKGMDGALLTHLGAGSWEAS